MGSFLAAGIGNFRWDVCILTIWTTILLQILSNLSNDYGDYVNGADHDERSGPKRAVQSGKITPSAMKNAIILFGILSLVSGLTLLYLSVGLSTPFFIFLLLGLLSIAAAVYYTMGDHPYGYMGLGDISVFIFFGLLAVGGTYYLHGNAIDPAVLLPGASCGLLAVAVLNINNIRDIESDKMAGKRSIPVRIGRKNAVVYHIGILVLAMALSIAFTILHFRSGIQFLFLIVLPLIIMNIRAVIKHQEASKLDPFLKQMALTTLAFVLLFGVGLLVG